MRRLHKSRTPAEQLAAQGDGVTLFCNGTQKQRVEIARRLVAQAVNASPAPHTIYELGCGAGEISGSFSAQCSVTGVEIIPAAVQSCQQMWPQMTIIPQPAEQVPPVDCSVLVLCEFLEHLHNPEAVVKSWLPRASFAVIGHPLDEPDPPFERGHCWSYSWDDFKYWLELGHHQLLMAYIFPVPPCYTMVYGLSQRRA